MSLTKARLGHTIVESTYYLSKNELPDAFRRAPRGSQPMSRHLEGSLELELVQVQSYRYAGEQKRHVRKTGREVVVIVPDGARVEYLGAEKDTRLRCYISNVTADGITRQLNVYRDGTLAIRAYTTSSIT